MSASLATPGMEPRAKLSAKMAVETEERALLPMCVPAHKASRDPAVRQTLTSALRALFSVTAVPTASTCLGGITVSAETATMTMGCLRQAENPVKILTNAGLGGTAAPTTPFASTWTGDTIAGVPMGRTALGTACTRGK